LKGTNFATNANAMLTIQKNTIFTNVAKTSDGDVFWEGMEPKSEKTTITSWMGDSNWNDKSSSAAAHPNSRYFLNDASFVLKYLIIFF